ncbi:MAG: PTS sugar transporter subunit IIC [Clostridium sp.]|uniref:PTS sugar transporter subunit IIC n=1 Tax=Clostridium sp. TaxID=1506 RepID=UPI0025808FD5|nr:PTS transporter subunit EIIC [Clostridium sp.]MBS6887152.1 PTS sugar transporter subunit IIC [Clostridium sp.]
MEGNKFLDKLDRVLSPIGSKLGNQRHLKAISAGMMMPLALIVVGALFLVIANPPINPDLVNADTANFFVKGLLSWKEFAVENYAMLTAPFNMTMGMFGLMSAFSIAYSLANEYKMKASISGLISLSVFLMICAPAVEGGISIEISRFLKVKGLEFKLPDSVPSAVTSFINSILPVVANIAILYGLNIILVSSLDKNLPDAIMGILTPALSVVDNLWGFIFLITFSNLLWLFGVNGTSIIFPIVFSLGIANSGLNAELVAAGQAPTNLMNLQMFRIAIMGGAGNTIGLIILMMKSRSTHLKTLGRLSIVPGMCGINEPVIFGGPIVFNPILAIPFLITPIVSVSLTYFVQSIGLITPGYIVDPSFTPFFAQAYLSSLDWRNVVFVFLLIPISMVIYYPFFKIFEKKQLKEEGIN